MAALAVCCAGLLLAAGSARAAAPSGFVGINAPGLFARDDAYQEQMLSLMQANGVTVVRQFFRWQVIEPAPGVFDFTDYDRMALHAAAHGIRLQVLLAGESPWGSTRPPGDTDHCVYPPRDPNEFADFATHVAQRYGRGGSLWRQHPEVAEWAATVYEIWNEPGIDVYWGCHSSPASYLLLSRTTGKAIRAVDSGATIINGSAPHKTIQTGFWPRVFRRMGRNERVFSAFGLHPYAPTVKGVLAIIRDARHFLVRFHRDFRPIYITEFGWATGGPRSKYTVSEATQARYVRTAYLTLWREREELGIQGITYYAWRDLPPPTDLPGSVDYWGLHTGLLHEDTTPKPALAALAQASQAMN
jgi:polysaccharide biosynthesis protein PslG